MDYLLHVLELLILKIDYNNNSDSRSSMVLKAVVPSIVNLFTVQYSIQEHSSIVLMQSDCIFFSGITILKWYKY